MLNLSAKVKISKRKTTFFVHKYVVNSLIISQKCRLLGLPLTNGIYAFFGLNGDVTIPRSELTKGE
jgi:hypothetical protein